MTSLPRRSTVWILLLFVGSGCSALIYEVVWFQLLELVVGATAVSLGVLLATFIAHDFTLPDPSATIPHLGVLGLMLMMVGFSTFCFTLLLHATSVSYGPALDRD